MSPGRRFCSLERGGCMTPRGGLRPPEPPRSRKILVGFWLIFALFPSAPRKLSLPPSDRSRRCDSDAPNESSVAQMRAELWPETCFCPYGALVERADRDRRVDRTAPNESSVAQLRAELWPETCFCPDVHPKRQGRIHGFCGALDDHPCMH